MTVIAPLPLSYNPEHLLHSPPVTSFTRINIFYEPKVKTVLFEYENKSGFIQGFTENYVKVKTPFKQELVNTIKQVYLREIDKDGLFLVDFV